MTEANKGLSRRAFLGLGAAAAALAGAGLAGCSPAAAPSKEDAAAAAVNDWLGAEPEIPEDKIVETVDTEILVCGAGTSGLFAACSAAEEGAKVVCLEKAAIGGGVRDNLGLAQQPPAEGGRLRDRRERDMQRPHALRRRLLQPSACTTSGRRIRARPSIGIRIAWRKPGSSCSSRRRTMPNRPSTSTGPLVIFPAGRPMPSSRASRM